MCSVASPPVRPHDAGVPVHAGAPLPGPGPAPRPAHVTVAHLVPVVRRARRRVIANLAQLYGSEHGDTLLQHSTYDGVLIRLEICHNFTAWCYNECLISFAAAQIVALFPY